MNFRLIGFCISAMLPTAVTAVEVTDTTTRNLDEVVVTGTRSPIDKRLLPMTVSVVGRSQIEEAHQPSLLPILTADVPGLFATQRGMIGYGVSGGSAGSISMRGLSGNGRLMVLVDGHPQYAGIMGHPIADAATSVMTERVEVVRGPASVVYGSNAMGGVVNIVTRSLPSDGIKTNISLGGGSYGTVQADAVSRIRKGAFGTLASLNYGHTDGHRRDMTFDQYSGFAKLTYDFSPHWNAYTDIDLLHFHSANPGEVASPLADARQSVTRGTYSVALQNRYADASGSISFFYNWGNHWINDGHSPNASARAYRFLSRDHTGGVSLFESFPLFRGNSTTVGFDYMNVGGKAWNHYVSGVREGENDILADKREDMFAGYVDVRQTISSLTLNAGVRADRHSHMGTEWVPQGGVSWQMPHSMSLKASASKGFRYPTMREMYMFPPQNPDLKPEKMWSYELAFTHVLPSAGIDYALNLYYINGDNLIQSVPRQGASPLNMNTGRVENYGVEGQASWLINSNWRVAANYSFLHMKKVLLSAPDHKLNISATYSRSKLSIYTAIQYVNGLHTAPDKTEDFILWNLTAQYSVFRHVDIWTRLDNILAQKYEYIQGFPMPRMTTMFGVNINL